jgi:hypothetical protein
MSSESHLVCVREGAVAVAGVEADAGAAGARTSADVSSIAPKAADPRMYRIEIAPSIDRRIVTKLA